MQKSSLFSTTFLSSVCRCFDNGHSDWYEVIPHCSFDLHLIIRNQHSDVKKFLKEKKVNCVHSEDVFVNGLDVKIDHVVKGELD